MISVISLWVGLERGPRFDWGVWQVAAETGNEYPVRSPDSFPSRFGTRKAAGCICLRVPLAPMSPGRAGSPGSKEASLPGHGLSSSVSVLEHDLVTPSCGTSDAVAHLLRSRGIFPLVPARLQ